MPLAPFCAPLLRGAEMKPNGIIILASVAVIAAAFGVALLSGAHMAQRNALIANPALIADVR